MLTAAYSMLSSYVLEMFSAQLHPWELSSWAARLNKHLQLDYGSLTLSIT